MQWINVAACLIIVAEYLSFYYVFLGKRELNRNKKIYICLAIGDIIAMVIQCMSEKSGLIFLCITAMESFIHVMLIYKIKWGEMLNTFFFTFPLLSIIESIFVFFIDSCTKMNDDQSGIFSIILTVILIWGFYEIIGKKLDREAFILPKKINALLSIVMFTIVIMFVYFTYIIQEAADIRYPHVAIGLAIVGGIIILTMVLIMIYSMNAKQKYYKRSKHLSEYGELQKEYFEMLLNKEGKTRQFRHDIMAELMQIKSYVERKEYQALDKYVEQSLHELDLISNYNYDVGNEVVNILLNHYLIPVKDNCSINVKGYISETINIEDRDLCIMVSNLLSNAVEAIKKINKNCEKLISFNIKSGKYYTYIIVENTCLPKCSGLQTDKQDRKNHGFGIKNIKKTVKKYNGNFLCKVEDNLFYSEIQIKNDRLSKK